MSCITRDTMVEDRIDRILTQYRESPKLLSIIRHDIAAILDLFVMAEGLPGKTIPVVLDDAALEVDGNPVVAQDPDCQKIPGIPERFDIFTAIGDQLTILGKYLGFPRCHCICQNVPYFGFACEETRNVDIVGFCEEGGWYGCGEGGTADICFNDDEIYRRYLLARRYQARALWDIDSLQAAVVHIWGRTASAVSIGGANVAIIPGRELSALELIQLPVAFRVLPIAPGITPYISYEVGLVFGFGAGWGGMCDGSNWYCPVEFDPYECD